jgi:transposase-like protein
MSQQAMRVFSTELEEGVVLRLEGGERLGAVAHELKIKRKLLYEWRAAYRAMGVAGLNRKRGPKKGILAAREDRRIGAQGRQAADGSRFFREALRLIDALEVKTKRDVLYVVIETMSAPETQAPPRLTICARWRKCPAPASIALASFASPSGRRPTCATKSRLSR